jgi:hypothetical protein
VYNIFYLQLCLSRPSAPAPATELALPPLWISCSAAANPWSSRPFTRSRSSRGDKALTCGIQDRIHRVSSLRLEVCRRD